MWVAIGADALVEPDRVLELGDEGAVGGEFFGAGGVGAGGADDAADGVESTARAASSAALVRLRPVCGPPSSCR